MHDQEIGAFLADVRRGLSMEMPDSDVDAVLQETEQHLRERIQALNELGLSDEQATRESIECFGTAFSYTRMMLDAHGPSLKTREERILRFSWAASLSSATLIWACMMLDKFQALWVPLLPIVALAAVSYRLRKQVLVKLISIAFWTFVFFTIIVGSTHLSLAISGGTGVLPPWQVEPFTISYQELLGTSLDAYARIQLAALERAQAASLLENIYYAIPQTFLFGIFWLFLLLSANGLGAAVGVVHRTRRLGKRFTAAH